MGTGDPKVRSHVAFLRLYECQHFKAFASRFNIVLIMTQNAEKAVVT